MEETPTKQELISLVESMCEVQDRMLGARGMPEHIQRPHVDNMEALKAPVFFLWELLGYGTPRELSEKGAYSGAYSFISSATSSDTTRSLDVV